MRISDWSSDVCSSDLAVGSNATNGALGALTVNSTGLTTFGNVAAASLVTNAGGSTQLGGTITTSGTQTYNDAVTLSSDAVLTTTESGSAACRERVCK